MLKMWLAQKFPKKILCNVCVKPRIITDQLRNDKEYQHFRNFRND